MAILEVDNIKKSFGDLEVLKGITFSMEKGEVLAVIGSSGGGKTTLLRCLTFLERSDSGRITIDGEEIVGEGEFVVKSKKKKGETSEPDKIVIKSVYPNDGELRVKGLKMGLVFQDFNLFPEYSVLGNLTLAPILVQKKSKEEEVEQENQ